jgi:phenylpyruvate tautomerase PptA (4-oxalocrotonate tautomerase family)
MPYLSLTFSHRLFEGTRDRLLHEASAQISATLNKPESDVVVAIRDVDMLFGGESGPSAFVEVRSIGGLDVNTSTVLSAKLCDLLEHEAEISPARVLLNFVEVKREDWVWNGATAPPPAPVKNRPRSV